MHFKQFWVSCTALKRRPKISPISRNAPEIKNGAVTLGHFIHHINEYFHKKILNNDPGLLVASIKILDSESCLNTHAHARTGTDECT